MPTHVRGLLALISVFVSRLALGGDSIPNWSAPETWSPPRSHGVAAQSERPPLPFIAITPCRVADTRGNGFTGAYGPPALVANATRNFAIAGQCGIPVGTEAVSFNFAALNVGGAGDLRVFPAGGGVPLVSTLNYNAGTPNIANAAVVPLGSGAITVQADAVSVDLIIDVNGYYSSTFGTPQNFFRINNNSTSFSMWTTNNSPTCVGACGILADIASASGAAAIWGESTAATGAGVGVRGRSFSTGPSTYGVYGTTSSNDQNAAGVRGVDGTGAPPDSTTEPSSGVRGDSATSLAVFGISKVVGVRGKRVDNSGTEVALGDLGLTFSAVPYGVFSRMGDIGCVSCTKSFVDPHPTDPSRTIRYVSLEGNEAGTYFRGTAHTVNGEAVIEVPEDFRMVTDEEGLTVQLTPVGRLATLAVTEENLHRIVVRSSHDVKFHYLVQGIRPAFKDYRPIQAGDGFMPLTASERMPNWPEWTRKRLIANGTYNEDGTVNRETARHLGWDKVWEERTSPALSRSPD